MLYQPPIDMRLQAAIDNAQPLEPELLVPHARWADALVRAHYEQDDPQFLCELRATHESRRRRARREWKRQLLCSAEQQYLAAHPGAWEAKMQRPVPPAPPAYRVPRG